MAHAPQTAQRQHVARRLHIQGIVQGVGFRPFVYRLAHAHGLCGWVRNGESGVDIYVEGEPPSVESFEAAIAAEAPAAAHITSQTSDPAPPQGLSDFVIRDSERRDRPTTALSPDLPTCAACLRELQDPEARRFRYPYINCTECGPRYSIIMALPYDRPNTTMRAWPMCAYCQAQYDDPRDRRFHAQPIACPQCGPKFSLRSGHTTTGGDAALDAAAMLLRNGAIVAVKSLGGYHLACDARNAQSVQALRERKFRKERPFAVMVPDVAAARELAELSKEAEALLTSVHRPIVLARSKTDLAGVAPDNDELGIMLPYTPLQHLLFTAGAPATLVMTSANRSSEPIAYADDDAAERLAGIADAFLVGERPIARRMDDSVARAGPFGNIVLRRARGYAPDAVATLPCKRPLLAVGADLKNAVALVIEGQAFVSQHIGDLEHYQAFEAFKQTIADLCSMYAVTPDELLVVHDAHPEYQSTVHASGMSGEKLAVQHHRAHVASVLAERGAFDADVLGVAFDGTGYGDDGTIWGGEFFSGSIRGGLRRHVHLREALLAGGDAAARFPVQAAAGFLDQINSRVDFSAPPFCFPERYDRALQLVRKRVRVFGTTSIGRLFDTAAALVGFTRPVTFEGQAAMWLEHRARASAAVAPYAFPLQEGELDFRPLLESIIADRLGGRNEAEIARAFHESIARGISLVAESFPDVPVVLSGGVFQNALLLDILRAAFGARAWTNQKVPPNDGGISLGQAALAATALS